MTIADCSAYSEIKNILYVAPQLPLYCSISPIKIDSAIPETDPDKDFSLFVFWYRMNNYGYDSEKQDYFKITHRHFHFIYMYKLKPIDKKIPVNKTSEPASLASGSCTSITVWPSSFVITSFKAAICNNSNQLFLFHIFMKLF